MPHCQEVSEYRNRVPLSPSYGIDSTHCRIKPMPTR